jgi:uncharacterized protein involved in outer membrane biogenesis
MNNFLLMLGALLVGILAALVAVPMVVDWNGYRGVFEEEASRLLGRDVRVGGAVAVRLLPAPYVRFEKLRIADPASTGGDPLFRAESVTMRLSVAPLLRGVLEAQSVELKKPFLRLAVDDTGQGNWRSLEIKAGSLPFVPADVTLQSVGIDGGTFLFVSATGKDLAQFEQVNGDFSAEGFDGPFKFKGTADWYGAARELRLATGKWEADGALRVRANVRVPATQNTYAFDGRLVDLKGRPHVDGDLTAKLPVAGATDAKAPNDKAPNDGAATAFELKAKVDADLTAAKLTDIALSLDSVGDPQLVTGDVKAAWGEALRFDTALETKSLNLDRIAAAKPGTDPLETARAALNVLLSMLPADSQTTARFKADRVTLGGDVASGVSFAVERREQSLEVRSLRALLPGNTRFDAAGTVARDGASWGFVGPVALRGGNLAKFLGWARQEATGPSLQTQTSRYDGAFSLEGQLASAGSTTTLTRATVDIGGMPLTGEVQMAGVGRRKLTLTLDGQRLDAARVWPGGLVVDRLRETFNRSAAALGDTGFFGFNPDTTDLVLDVRAGEFQATPALRLDALEARLAVDHGRLDLTRVKFALPSGLAVDLDGTVAGLAQVLPASGAKPAPTDPARPRTSNVRFVLAIPSSEAATDLMTLLAVAPSDRPTLEQVTALGPMRLAGSFQVGRRDANAVDLAIDGTLDGRRATVQAAFSGGIAGWRTAALDVAVNIETNAVDRWLSLVGLGGSQTAPRTPGSSNAGQLYLKATGVPETGVTAFASLASDGLGVAYQGAGRVTAKGRLGLDGVAGITARDLSDALSMAGIALGQGKFGVPVQGQLQVRLHDGEMALAARDLKFGAASVGGTATIGQAADAASPRDLQLDLEVSEASMSGLLSAISDRRQPASGRQDLQRSVWSDQPLALATLDALTGRIRLTAVSLQLQDKVALSSARLDATFAPGKLTVSELSGRGLGGAVTAQLTLAKTPLGPRLTGDVTVDGGSLAALDSGLAVPFSGRLSFDSQGASFSGLIASVRGDGTFQSGPGRITGVAPIGVAGPVEQALMGKLPLSGEPLAQAIRDGLAVSMLAVPARKLAVRLSDGVARTGPAVFETADGKTALETSVDLNTLRFTTESRIEASARPGATGKAKAPLPGVVATVSGTLTNLADADRKLATTTLEQELQLRKIERDAEELERLRKLDDERRRQEDERRAMEEAEQAAKAAAALAATQSAPGQSPPGDGTQPPNASTQTLPPGVGQPVPPSAQAGSQETPPAPEPAARSNREARPANTPAGARRRNSEGIPQPLQNNF